LGAKCRLHPNAVIGDLAQDLKFKGGVSQVVVGEGCVFREGVTVHRGTDADSTTRLGNRVYMMVQAHVGHNCDVADDVILVNCAALGGYVTVEQNAFLSAYVGIHQFCRVGAYALIAASTKIDHDLPPFVIVDGYPRAIRKVNRIGLQRSGFSPEEIAAVEKAYQEIAKANDAMACGRALAGNPMSSLARIGQFYANSKRGVVRRFGLPDDED
jgi:UDP-N-acetylglucosamine acyltransferase